MKAKKFLVIVCSVFVLLIAPVIAINIYINPYGYYGDYQLGEAPIFNAHIAKYYALKDSSFKPEAVVIGSSNSMRMLPATIDSLFGLKAFNYGVYHAGVEDFWCIANTLVNDLKIKPKLFIICIDDWNFKSYSQARDAVFKGAQNRLSYKPVFSKYLHDYSGVVLNWNRIKTAISFEQFETAYPLFIAKLQDNSIKKTILPLSNAFFKDGTRKFYFDMEGKDIVDAAEKGEYKLTDYLKVKHAEAQLRYPKGIIKGNNEDFEKFQEERLLLFEELISFLEKNNIKVIMNVMPLNNYFYALLKEHSNYEERIRTLMARLNRIRSQHPNVILVADNHLLKNFGGDTDAFFDQIHPTSVTSNKMLYSIKNKLGAYAF